MQWISDHAGWAWVILALTLVGVEIATLDLLFLMLAGGALLGAAAAGLGASAFWQVLLAVAGAVAMLFVVRPVALRHLNKTTPQSRTGVAALIGQQALVLEPVDAHTGRIKLAGEVWSARTYDPTLVLDSGSMVDVLAIEGATAVVHATHL